jgi:FlaA1/EpsC-like NDP-sugar epimerase
MLVVLVTYSLGLTASLFLAYQLRFDFSIPGSEIPQLLRVGAWVIPLKLVLLLGIGQFAGLLSYFSIPDLRRLTRGLALASFLVAAVWCWTGGAWAPPRSVILADGLLSLLFLSAIRLLFRLGRERYFTPEAPPDERVVRVGIVGAGYAGSTLARELSIKRHLGLRPVCFFDDDPQKWGSRLHDIPVFGPPERLEEGLKKFRLDKAVIAMPSASGKRIREVVKLLQQASLKFETVPTLDQLAAGKVKVTQLRPVDIEDLLGREPVRLETEDIRGILKGQVVMVTGAGGSIGSELCRQIAAFQPEKLLLVEQSEVQMFQIEQELIGLSYGAVIRPMVAHILDYPRMDAIFEQHRPGVVFHAAAHKHVPMMENHPSEAIKNNTLGTAQLAELALEYEVERFVLISTDKAINPTNVMGATKRLAEIFLQALAAAREGQTKFMAVRFGNVLGSSGSVIPIFNKQIAAGGPVKVTHPEVTRYFMTIPEAVGLVLQSAAQGEGGEIFVLDMGKPVKILDLARQLIELSGLKPGVDIEIQFTGLRPGEKLYEELSHAGENCLSTNHPKIMRFISRPAPLRIVQQQIKELTRDLHRSDPGDLKLLLRKAVPEYLPCLPDSKPKRLPTSREVNLLVAQSAA